MVTMDMQMLYTVNDIRIYCIEVFFSSAVRLNEERISLAGSPIVYTRVLTWCSELFSLNPDAVKIAEIGELSVKHLGGGI